MGRLDQIHNGHDTQNLEGGYVHQTHDEDYTQIIVGGDVEKTREELVEHGLRSDMEIESRKSLFQAYQDFTKVQGFCVSSINF